MSKLDRYRPALIPGLALAVLLIAAFGAPLFAPYDPTVMDIIGRNNPPSANHWLGQDNFGRDILSRLLYGARVSLTVAIVSAAIAMALGVTLGLIGGYFRGLSEIVTLRLVDIILSFPPILLALLGCHADRPRSCDAHCLSFDLVRSRICASDLWRGPVCSIFNRWASMLTLICQIGRRGLIWATRASLIWR